MQNILKILEYFAQIATFFIKMIWPTPECMTILQDKDKKKLCNDLPSGWFLCRW